jgi:flavin-dependent dehydrogenase
MSSQANDFLVIGGGPAGCAFAILAARAGASVVLVERDHYGHFRAGEHLAGRVRPMLDALRVSREQANTFTTISPGIYSSWDGDEPVTKLYGATGQATGLCVVRHRFDELLSRSAGDAGATVLLSSKLTSIERSRTHQWDVTITEAQRQRRQLVARSVVDASGRNAVIARMQGARRIQHGDLVAIVRWLEMEEAPARPHTLLTVESCAYGWWSVSIANQMLVATLYTSMAMMRSAGATADEWWTLALDDTHEIDSLVRSCRSTLGPARVYSACPSRSSHLVGDSWITVGDAAIALDPLSGQGVGLALETAFRAFEAARVDPSWSRLGQHYSEALISRFQTHLEKRTDVYEEAAAVLPESFLRSAVMARYNDTSPSTTPTFL